MASVNPIHIRVCCIHVGQLVWRSPNKPLLDNRAKRDNEKAAKNPQTFSGFCNIFRQHKNWSHTTRGEEEARTVVVDEDAASWDLDF
mmetsp:Transcript_7869/g.18207  ORF Transcript_7869/g.18207 Transcript_7869/m.18207 type:complete len:87 (+) Transcript_7869:1055-1315(+)